MLDKASLGAFINLQAHDPHSWARDLARLDKLAIDHVELWLEYEPTTRQVGELASVFGAHRTIMHGPFIGMSLATEWGALASLSIDRCHRAIEVAGAIGAELVTLHAGAHAVHGGHAAALKRLAARFARFTRMGSPVVTLENMPARGGATQEAVACSSDLAALEELLPAVSFTLDIGHCVQNDEDPSDVLLRYRESVRNVHLHDGCRGGRAHLPLGEGQLELDLVLETLDSIAYDGFLTLETLGWDALQRSLRQLGRRGVRGHRDQSPSLASKA